MSLLKDQINEGNLIAIRQGAEQLQVQREQLSANKLFTNDLIEENDELTEKNKKLEAENLFYKNLLTKPMNEIAALNGDFKETYQEQQTSLGEWIVSQRAFKEIAVKLGLQLDKNKEQVIKEGNEAEIKVLNNETEYGNNFKTEQNSEWADFYAPRIKAKQNIK